MQTWNCRSRGATVKALFLSAGTLALAQAAAAQTSSPDQGESSSGLEDIVVTAQRRSEDMQKVPISVSAISARALEATGLTSTINITQAVPSVQLARSGPAIQYFIRGVGNTSGGTGEEGPNAFYIDNIYIADLTSLNIEFNNIERVEVLKGPQGTLFGRNSSGGLINVITREPGDEFVLHAKTGYANYDTINGQVYVAGPLSDTLSADFAFTGRKQSDGWGRNLFNNKEFALGWLWGARSKLAWRPTDTAKLVIAGEYFKASENFAQTFAVLPGSVGVGGFTYPGDYNLNTSDPSYSRRQSWALSATGEIDFDWATLTNITAVRSVKTRSGNEADYTPPQLLRLQIFTQSDTVQQELRLASTSTGPLSWQGGLFYLKIKTTLDDNPFRGTQVGGINSGYDLDSRMNVDSYAAFGELTYAITPTTHLTGGLRYTYEKRSLRASQVPINQVPGSPLEAALTLVDRRDKLKFEKLTYRAAIRQDINDDLNVYATYNRGFKAGLWGLQSPRNPPVKPQITDAIEIGLKSKLFDNTVRFNIAAFQNKIKGYQVRAASSSSLTLLLNAGSARVNGIESDIEIAPAEGLNLTAGVAFLDTKFTNFPGALFTIPNPSVCTVGTNPPGAPTGAPTGGNRTCIGDATGNKLPLASKFSGNIGVSYRVPLGNGDSALTFNARVSHAGAYFFEPDNRLRQKSYTLVNGSIEYRITTNWAVEIWGNNLTDTRYRQSSVGTPTADQGVLAPPRTYGANLKLDF